MRNTIDGRAIHLEPVDTPSTGLIGRGRGREHLDHQSLTSIFHALFEESLNLVGRTAVGGFCKIEFRLDRLKVLTKQLSPFFQLLCQQTLCRISGSRRILNEAHLSVQVQKVEREEMDPDSDILRSYILAFSPTQVLERKELLRLEVKCDSFRVDNE